MSRAGLPILTYHALDATRGVTATDPAWFAHTMAALHASGYRAVDLDDWIAQGRPAVERAFALAFDDGLASIRRAADVLARLGFPATAFVVTGRMGLDNAWPGQPASIRRAPLLSWPVAVDLQSAGFRLAAHTRSHPRLDRLAADALDTELAGSRADVEHHTGRPCRLLAYPYGIAPPRVRRAAARHFAAAFGTRPGYADSNENVYKISRIDACDLRTPRALDRLLSGRWGPWLRARRALRAARHLASL